jgi:hypothetical protein
MQNVNGQVKVFFVNDEKFKKAKINYLSDNSFSKFQMARKKVEEIIRTTK